MPKKSHIALPVIKRLPRYYRFLGDLLRVGVVKASSKELSSRMGLTASQIRQDLNCFGGFGQQGYGYNVEQLRNEIGQILGVDNKIKTIIIGAGNLGKALANSMDFMPRGFELTGIFDVDPDVIGTNINGLIVLATNEIEQFCKDNEPACAVLCIPKIVAPLIAEKLVSLGIKGFWNFSHYDLGVMYPDIPVENVHLGDSLMTLGYRIKQENE